MKREVKIEFRSVMGITDLDLEYEKGKLVAIRGASGSTGDQPKSENLLDLLMFARYIGGEKTLVDEIDAVGKNQMKREDENA